MSKTSNKICEVVTAVRAKHARRKEARPGELLQAALDLFVEKGYAATRVEEVAQRAGVSKGTLFLYFASKEELFKAVVRENISGRFPGWNAQMDAYTGSTAELLRTFMEQWWVNFGDTPASGITKLMFSEARNFPELAAFYAKEVIEPGDAFIRRILQRGIERKEFRPLELKYSVFAVLAPMLYLTLWKHSIGNGAMGITPLEPARYIKEQVDNMLLGFSVRSPEKET